MSELDEFVGRVRGLLISLSEILSPQQCAEVEHFIDHDEIGEALCALAWIIVDEDKRIPAVSIKAIRDLSHGLVEDREMPPGLDHHAIKP